MPYNPVGVDENNEFPAAVRAVLDGIYVQPTSTAVTGKVSKGELVVNVKDHGAKGDGVTDDTAAFAAALAAGDEVLVPPGQYILGSTVTVPTGKHLRGAWSSIYTAAPTWGARLRRPAAAAASTDPVLTLAVNAKVTELSVQGASNTTAQHNGIKCGGRNVIRDVTVSHCLNGIDGDYKGVIRVDNCQLHDNVQSGLIATVDSIIVNSYFNVNGTHGINLQAGANDNVISACKFEWNTGHGVNLFQNKHNIVTNNNIDRNGRAGISATTVDHGMIASNVLRRNGKNSAATPADDTQMYLQGCANLVIVGNVTETGGDDDGSGYVSPLTAIRIQDGTNNRVMANDLTGFTSAAVNVVSGGSTNVYQGNTGYDVGGFVDLTTAQTIAGTKTFQNNVILQAAFRHGYTLSTASATLTVNNTTDRMVDATAGQVTLTLPGTTLGGLHFIIKKVDASANKVIVAGTIDGATNYELTTQYQFVHVVSSQVSGQWFVIAKG